MSPSVSKVWVALSFVTAPMSPADDGVAAAQLLAHDVRQVREAFVFLRAVVVEVSVASNRAAEYAEVRQASHELVGAGLEHERRNGSVGVGGQLFGFAGDLRRDRRHVDGAGEFVVDRAQERHAADVRGAGGAEDRYQRPGRDRRGEAVFDLLVAQLFALEILESKVVIRFRDALRQPVARGGDGVVHVVGHGRLALAVALVGLAVQDVDDAAEGRLKPYRQLQGLALGTQLRLNLRDELLPAGVLAVQPADDDRPGHLALLGQAPGRIRAHLHPRRGVNQDQGRVGGGHAGDHLSQEVGVAGGVDQIDPGRLTARRQVEADDGGAAAHAALLLVRIEVGDGVAVFHPALPADRAGGEGQRLHQRGLAGATVGYENDVADLGGADAHGPDLLQVHVSMASAQSNPARTTLHKPCREWLARGAGAGRSRLKP